MSRISRRDFMVAAAAAAVARPSILDGRGLPAVARTAKAGQRSAADPWVRARAIVESITVPRFPSRDFEITRYGAVGDGVASCTSAIGKAVAACRAAGGGRVVVPRGRYLTGAVCLESGVNLHLAEGATLAFSAAPADYPLVFTRWEGVELMNYSPFIYAFEAENIAITGTGTLDGQAGPDRWWNWRGTGAARGARQTSGRTRLFDMQARGVPVAERIFGDGHFLRPNFIQPYRSRNVLIDGVTIVNSPMWEIHPVLCRSVTVRNVTITSHGPNNDGCNPESCRDVLIERCSFDTGDDCIALKSGRNDDGRRLNVPVENVVIRDCSMKDGHGGVVIGSEISGGARNVFAERCRMDSPRLDRALRMKTNSVRGGVIEGVYMRDVTVGQVAEAVVTIDFFYEEGDSGKYPPTVRDVEVRNVTSRKSQYALLLRGYGHAPITGVRIVDCRFDGVEKADVLEAVRDLELANVSINGKALTSRITR
ncbi:MAG TPA: glycoside hydrolase family 28 protein [Vicinamibacterales bacterium]|nr:glycoside hydrolase family 28 protein [Vicinamibacterales bacterium]